MGRVALIRHSLPLRSTGSPASSWPLSAEGERRCAELAEALRPWAPVRLFSSAELKARQTATLVATVLNRPVIALPGLQEHDRRGVGLMPEAQFRAAVARLFYDQETLFFGRETARQARLRFTAAVDKVADPQATVALFSHGTVITLYLAATAGIDPIPFWTSLGMPALIVLSWPEKRILHVSKHVPADQMDDAA